ncbi:SRP-independent targeting protein 3 [Dictyocoela muelleri]|nr:SRP-independent targeting protein 3 [Dictyocoela muelleri]
MAVPLTTIDQITNLALSLLSMHLFKKYNISDPKIILIIRSVYICSQSILFLMLFLIKRSIDQKNDLRRLKVKVAGSDDQEEEITFADYDKEEYMKMIRSSILQFFLIGVFHFKWNIVAPLIIQSIGVFKNIFLNPLFIAHLRQKEVIRPFEKNMLWEEVKETPKKRKKEE